MKIAAITAGAAGMVCGSCLRDNALAAALLQLGHDALLVPTYTPLTLDEPDVSQRRVFLGGISVYLEQSVPLFRRVPRWLRRMFDHPGLLRLVSRYSGGDFDYAKLGPMTVSMLRGLQGNQRQEIADLVDWLAADVKPEIVTLSNVLLSGLAPVVRARLGVPVLAYLQGDDIFLDALTDADRRTVLDQIGANARSIDGYIATSSVYADRMADYLGLSRAAIDVVYPGLNLTGHGGERSPRQEPPLTIGYFARLAPEKGLHLLARAYVRLRGQRGVPPCRLRASGWGGPQAKGYLSGVRRILQDAGLLHEFEYVESPAHADKVRFLRSLDLFSVPTLYGEPKGLYVLEALANGVPVVQPRHGSFPELLDETGGGLLVAPADADDLARGLRRLIDDPVLRHELGAKGQAAVRERFTAEVMARKTVEVLQRYLPPPP